MGNEKPTYEELKAKLVEAEQIIEALRSEEVDAVMGKKRTLSGVASSGLSPSSLARTFTSPPPCCLFSLHLPRSV